MNTVEHFITPNANYTLNRIPKLNNDTLRAWDAADELLVNTIFAEYGNADGLLQKDKQSIIVINDTFGALTVAFNKNTVDNWSDSLISHLAAKENLEQNKIESAVGFIPATENLQKNYDLVVIKIPKTLSLLEDQLYKLKPHINKDTKIIAAAMTKHIHNSTLDLFEKIIGTTTTSLAKKKARLIFAENNIELDDSKTSPYPIKITEDKIQLSLINHANVFSKDKLDVGTRFLIQNIDQCPAAEHVIDIGCGNGALGIMLKRHQPTVKISFTDESYNALASAKQSYDLAYPESSADANFYSSNALEQFSTQSSTQLSEPPSTNKAQLVLCNPPFHQVHSIGDHIAWEMFTQSREALETHGEMWVVGNRHLGYHIKLKKVFGNCRTIASNPKFVILAAKKVDKLIRTRK